ncbi:MAG: MBL fold metallo-hydrolase [Chloroflexi bacterium]|nr:MBL fold metallo-hydrolase [Chloroflexota bacterium]
MEIVPGVHSLPAGPAAFTGVYAPNAYLVGGGGFALVDTGLKDAAVLEARLSYLQREGVAALKYILITHAHPDHLGGAAFFQRALGGEVIAHWSEEERLRSSLSGGRCRLVTGGDRLPLGDGVLEVIYTPGHCPGHLCYLWRGKGVLFSGDHVPGRGTTVIIPPRGDMGLYLDSLRRLLPLELRAVCPGHGPPIARPGEKIRELVQHRLEREAQIIAVLARGGARTEDLVRGIYPELDPRLEEMARGQVLAHLIKLKNEGKAERRGGRWVGRLEG